MYSYLKKYSRENKEQFNRDFILSRNDKDVLEYVKDIFKSLEILGEIEILEIRLDTDESNFLPAINNSQYYKPILPSRLNKIHYKVKITPSEEIIEKPILKDETEKMKAKEPETGENKNSFIIEKDLFINKLVNDYFYINEGIRYFLIYQIVDNSTYGTKESVSLKSLLMPITVRKKTAPTLNDFFDTTKSYVVPSFDVLLFSKRINPVLYVMGKYAYNSIVGMEVKNKDTIILERESLRDKSLFNKFNYFFGTDIKFSEDPNELLEKGRTVINIKGEEKGLFVSVDTEQLKNHDQNLMSILGSLADIRTSDNKKKPVGFSYEEFMTPSFWIDKLSGFFTNKTSDFNKKFEKIKTMLISLERLMDNATRKILNLSKEDKKNTLYVIRYIMRNFDALSKEDNQNLDNKRIRLYEYQLYPLRKYFSDQIYRVLNSATRSRNILDRIFSNLNPMYIIKQTVVNELLRYYNSTNEMNLYSCLLKYTFRGPQSINKTVSVFQRDLHPSYTGRLSLVASSASDPGISGSLVPFVELDGYYFKKQEKEEDK
jgi:hypothetical protein